MVGHDFYKIFCFRKICKILIPLRKCTNLLLEYPSLLFGKEQSFRVTETLEIIERYGN
jgi:hypothetical protein